MLSKFKFLLYFFLSSQISIMQPFCFHPHKSYSCPMYTFIVGFYPTGADSCQDRAKRYLENQDSENIEVRYALWWRDYIFKAANEISRLPPLPYLWHRQTTRRQKSWTHACWLRITLSEVSAAIGVKGVGLTIKERKPTKRESESSFSKWTRQLTLTTKAGIEKGMWHGTDTEPRRQMG